MDIDAIEARRREILHAMEGVRAMRPGTLSEQFLKVPQKGHAAPALRGPYYLWQYYDKGKPVRRRVPREQVQQAQQEVDNRKYFEQLCKEFELLTYRLGQLEGEQAQANEAVKKKPSSPSPRTRKSSG